MRTEYAPRVVDLPLTSGRVRVGEWGDPHAGATTLCVHGLSANLHAFGFLASRIAPDRRVVAFDLRGRGRSEVAAPGTYGLRAHARDVLELADRLRVDRFDLVGWSLGALIGITAATIAPDRLRSLALIDHGGFEDLSAQDAVRQGLARLDAVVDDEESYLHVLRAAGVVTPWSAWWDAQYGYELQPVAGGFSPSTDRAACLEDLDHPDRPKIREAWPALTMPALLVRATVPMGGDVVTPQDRDGLAAAAADLRVLELDRNHFGVVTDERTAAAVQELAERAA